MPTTNTEILSTLSKARKAVEAFPEFIYLGDPVLRQKSTEVDVSEGKVIGKQLGDLLKRYRELMGYGRGLAAPQIGILRRVFVTYFDNEVQICINPRFVSLSERKSFYRELCLSNVDVWGDIQRPSEATLEWLDENGNRQSKKADGGVARVWQHELDHLDGVLCLDHANPRTLSIVTSDPLKEIFRDKPL